MAKERMVTRTVIESKTYQIYSMEGTTLTPLGTETTKGKLSERDLEKKYDVKKVVIDCIEEKKATYGVPVEDFMEIATRIDQVEPVENVNKQPVKEEKNKTK